MSANNSTSQHAARFSKRTLFAGLLAFFGAACGNDSTVAPKITAPELLISANLSAIAGEEFSRVIVVNDAQGLPVTVTVDGLPAWLAFIPGQLLLRGTPSVRDGTIRTIRITATNGTHTVMRETDIRVFGSAKEKQLQEQLETLFMANTGSMRGVSIAVVDASGQSYAAFMGRMGSSPTHPRIERIHKYRLASVTKPMTTALILKLIEEGKLGLDDIITSRYSTALPNANSITVRHLLTHTGGVFDHLNANVFWSSPQHSQTKVWTVPEIVQFAVNHGPLFTPGTSYAYSNTGFVVLGALIETVTGLSLPDAFSQMLFSPLGLSDILYDDFSTTSNPIQTLVFNSRSYEYHATAAGASGAMVGSPTEVARFGWHVYGGRYVSAALTNLMSINHGSQVGGQNYGLGTRIWTVAGIRHHGHTGNLMNYRNILMYVPEADISIAMHTHDPHTGWNHLIDAMLAYVVTNFSDRPVKRLPFVMYADDVRELDNTID